MAATTIDLSETHGFAPRCGGRKHQNRIARFVGQFFARPLDRQGGREFLEGIEHAPES
jgi:hypothetical protein